MTNPIEIHDELALSDLETLLARSLALDEDAAIRLQTFGRVLLCTVAPLFPLDLWDEMPTILGVRTLALGGERDSLVPALDRLTRVDQLLSALRERVRDEPVALGADPDSPPIGMPWSGIAPPRTGWRPNGRVAAATIAAVAREGIETVKRAAAANANEASVRASRVAVWGEVRDELLGAPAGMAFAASGLGFIRGGNVEQPAPAAFANSAAVPASTTTETAAISTHDDWIRLSCSFGDVFARQNRRQASNVFTMAVAARSK